MSILLIIEKARDLIRTHDEIKENVQARDEKWRNTLVRQRRAIALLVGETGTLLTEAIACPDASLKVRDVQEALSKVRARLAYHQASWPAVMLDQTTNDYRASVENVRAAFATFEARIDDLERSSPTPYYGV